MANLILRSVSSCKKTIYSFNFIAFIQNIISNFSSLFQKARSSNFRHIIFPIRSHEFSKFLLMALWLLSILLIQNMLRVINNAHVITHLGTQVISFIQLWLGMPIGFFFILLYTRLCNSFTTEQVFRIITFSFLLLFFVIGFIIYPNSDFFHPDPNSITNLIHNFPHLKWFFIILGNWSLSLLYVLYQSWAIIAFFLCFWQLANKITNTKEAKRTYPFLVLVGQFGLLLPNMINNLIVENKNFLTYWISKIYSQNINTLFIVNIFIICFLCLVCVTLHRIIEIKNIESLKQIKYKEKRTDILKLSVLDSLKMVINSKYLLFIALLMICYSTSVNLIEGLWLSRTKALYQTSEEVVTYMSTVLYWTGISTISFIIIGSVIIRYCNWFWAALLSPLTIGIAGFLFFAFTILEINNYLDIMLYSVISMSPLFFVVLLGALQNILGKGVKYATFDASKELLYIPLDSEMKTKGKAAVDVIGSKIGQSLGSVVQILAFTILPCATHEDIAIFLMIVFTLVCLIWIYAVFRLNTDYKTLLKNKMEKVL